MSTCNYCLLQYYKKMAKKKGNKLVIRLSGFMGGVNVFETGINEVVPKYIEPNDDYPNGDSWYEEHNKAWMMEIGDHCIC